MLLPLTVRTANCLQRANIATITQMLKLSQADMMDIRNMGRKSVQEVLQWQMSLRTGADGYFCMTEADVSEDDAWKPTESQAELICGLKEKLGLEEVSEGIFKQYMDARKGKVMNHCCIYGVFCGAIGVGLEEVLSHYLYGQTSAMVTNCVKTIPLSQTAGQQILAGCYSCFQGILHEVLELAIDDLCLSAPGFDIRGIQHEKLYSRIYMS
jgi:urease accessory protein UreF